MGAEKTVAELLEGRVGNLAKSLLTGDEAAGVAALVEVATLVATGVPGLGMLASETAKVGFARSSYGCMKAALHEFSAEGSQGEFPALVAAALTPLFCTLENQFDLKFEGSAEEMRRRLDVLFERDDLRFEILDDIQQTLKVIQNQLPEFSNIVEERRCAPPLIKGSFSNLLRPEYGVVPFDQLGRASEMEDLRAWCHGDGVSVWLWHGPGGVGKTRLFINLAAEMIDAHGWRAGFLRRGAISDMTLRKVFGGPEPSLVVVDYAESRTTVLRVLLDAAGDLENGPLKIVLLARAAGKWWERLARELDPVKGGRLLSISPTPRTLSSSGASSKDKIRLFSEACAAFRTHVSTAHDAAPSVPDLEAEHFERMLYLHIAALAFVAGRSVSGAEELLQFVLEHENRYWKETLRDANLGSEFEEVLAPCAAIFVLSGGAPSKHVAIEYARTLPALSDQPYLKVSRLISILRGCYPGERWLEPLQPDLLGEQHVVNVLTGDDDILSVLDNRNELFVSCLTVLDRIAARGGHFQAHLDQVLRTPDVEIAKAAMTVAVQTGGPIGQRLAVSLEYQPDPSVCVAIYEQLPERTVALGELAVVALACLLERLRTVEDTTADFRSFLAQILHSLGSRLCDLRRTEEALGVTEEAVDLLRVLADDDPGSFLSFLGRGLNNLCALLGDVGSHVRALDVSMETVGIYRNLAQEQPDAFLQELADGTLNLSNRLCDLGRYEEACDAAKEAVGIYRELAREEPDAFLGDLATGLGNLASTLSHLGQGQEALDAASEANDIFSKLVQEQPDAFLVSFAGSAKNISGKLCDLGQYEAALDAANRAVNVCRNLADDRPGAFLPTLAESLHGLGIIQSYLGQHEAALNVATEVVGIRRKLAIEQSDPFNANVAAALSNLGAMLHGAGQYDAALAASREGVDIRRKAIERRVGAVAADLAMDLSNLGIMLNSLGHHETAIEVGTEAVEIYRRLADERPDAFLAELARSALSLGAHFSAVGQQKAAHALTQEAVEIYRKLARECPDRFLSNLAMSLNNLGTVWNALEQHEDSVVAAQEAVEIYRKLANARPDAFLANFAMSLSSLGAKFSAIEQHNEALAVVKEAIGIRRGLARERPVVHMPDLAMSLNNLGATLNALGQHEEALDPATESLEILQNVASGRPGEFSEDLARSIINRNAILSALGRN